MPRREPLPCDEVVKAIERRGPSRIPMGIHNWCDPKRFGEREAEVRALLEEYPADFYFVHPRMPDYWDDPAKKNYIPGYSWMDTPPPAGFGDGRGHDAKIAIRDWSQLPAMLDRWPDANEPAMYDGQREFMERTGGGRYAAMHFWFCFYERLWSLRGMENILCDFYENPEPVHQLMDALTDFYVTVIRRAGRELNVQGFWTSDDIGTQTGPMFSPKIFHEFFKPRYARLAKAAHESGMHFWLHTCGDVSAFMEDFIEIGIDVIHPIQKYCMDERATAEKYGGRICFWAGMDVQRTLPFGTPEDVRREVRFLVDTFDRPDGGCMLTAGNGITPDVPTENLRAFFDECYEYGGMHREQRER